MIKLEKEALLKADETAFRWAVIEAVNQLVGAVNTGVVWDNKVDADRKNEAVNGRVDVIDETQRISFETLANGGQIDEQVVLAHKESISEWRYVDDKKKPVEYKLDQYVRHLDKLYKVIQEHTAQADWTPDIAPSLYEVIDIEHAGTFDDPIPFALGMTVYADKYYTYEGVLYKCTRDSGIGLNNPPNELIGHYFEVV